MSLYVQFLTMGLMLASGVAIGILFDLYRVLAHELRFPRWLIPLLDLTYWAAATLLVFRVLFYGNFGEVRLFVFLGLFAGYSFYFLAWSRTSVRIVRWLIRMVKAFIGFLVGAFKICVIKPLLLLYKFVCLIVGFLASATMFFLKIVIQLLYPLRFLIRMLGRAIRPYLRVPEWLGKPWRIFRQWLKR